MIPASKTITHTLAGASMASALLLVGLIDTRGVLPIPQPIAEAASAPTHLTLDPNRLTAKAAIVYDPLTKQILFAKNQDTRLPLASLTKLMSAEVVLSSTKGDEQITITPQDLKPSGDWGFRVGEVWSLKNLIKFGLVASSNDAMAAAASALGSSAIDTMNRRAKELGLTNMYFYNPTGLDLDEETAGAYGSVHDVALLAAAFLEQFPAQFEATAATSVSISEGKRTLEAEATAAPLLAIPGLIAAKTGYTDLAGGNLVAAIDMEVGHPVIVAVMGSTVDGRFEDVKLLTTQTHDLFTNHH